MKLHCVVTTGGAGHPDEVADASWNKVTGVVNLTSITRAPSTPPPPIATAVTPEGDDAVIAAPRVTRAVKKALAVAGALTPASTLTCGAVHASVAGCEVHREGQVVRYYNVLLHDKKLSIYPALG